MPATQAGECAVARRALPEHAEQEGREQRRVDEREHQLQDVHDVVELRRHIAPSATDAAMPNTVAMPPDPQSSARRSARGVMYAW